MKASELRIGNYIENTDSQMASYMVVNADVIKQNELKMYASLEPIQLTEEWLVKFGFEHEDHYLELQIHEHLSIIYMGYLALMIDGVIIQVNNTNSDKLHQLQNLYFALTGKELTLKS